METKKTYIKNSKWAENKLNEKLKDEANKLESIAKQKKVCVYTESIPNYSNHLKTSNIINLTEVVWSVGRTTIEVNGHGFLTVDLNKRKWYFNDHSLIFHSLKDKFIKPFRVFGLNNGGRFEKYGKYADLLEKLGGKPYNIFYNWVYPFVSEGDL